MSALTYAAATILGFNLGLIAAAVHAYRAEQRDRREVDELCALIVATREPEPEVAAIRQEPTPIGEAAWRAAIERACRIEAACDDFAAEIAANADAELAELLREES